VKVEVAIASGGVFLCSVSHVSQRVFSGAACRKGDKGHGRESCRSS